LASKSRKRTHDCKHSNNRFVNWHWCCYNNSSVTVRFNVKLQGIEMTEDEAMKGVGRDRNPLLVALAYQLMNYRGARSGLMRARGAIPNLRLTNDIEGQEVTVTIPFRAAG
jgi:hypothetical protein